MSELDAMGIKDERCAAGFWDGLTVKHTPSLELRHKSRKKIVERLPDCALYRCLAISTHLPGL